MVVGDAIGFDLLRRQVFGDMHRNFIQAKLDRSLIPRVPADDDAVGIDDDRLAKTELTYAGRHRIDGAVV